jgi:hypothetical protein
MAAVQVNHNAFSPLVCAAPFRMRFSAQIFPRLQAERKVPLARLQLLDEFEEEVDHRDVPRLARYPPLFGLIRYFSPVARLP